MGDAFIKWLIGDMGRVGEYQYQAIHLYSTAVVAAVLVAVLLIGYGLRKTPRHSRRLLVAISVFQLGFELLWRLVFLLVRHDPIASWWPMYPCNLGGILIPLIALMNNRRGKQLFYLFGFVGGVLTFALPDGIFCRDVLVFPILKSILQHTGLLLIPALELVTGTFRPTLEDMGWVTMGCVIHTVNCEGIDRLLGFTEDYMFFRSTLPFVIPGVPQFFTLSVFALLVLAILCFLCDIKGSIRFIKRLGKTKQKTP